MRYVVLATDAKPYYAIHAPVAVRLWSRLGYDTLLIQHVDSAGWMTDFGRVVVEELNCLPSVLKVVPIETFFPLSVANTMRTGRLIAAAHPRLSRNDFLLTADVDMYPLSRRFFDVGSMRFVVLRCLYQQWLATKNMATSPKTNLPSEWHDPIRFIAGEFRFPMCYAGATVEIWRELFPIHVADPRMSFACLCLGLDADSTDFDEAQLSMRFLSSRRAEGNLYKFGQGHWQKGQLDLIDPVEAPLISVYENMPRGLLRLGDKGPGYYPEGAIDFIPSRWTPNPDHMPWWVFDLAAHYWPEEKAWLADYRKRIEPTLKTAIW